MVTAPLQQNDSGGIYSYMKDANKSFTPKGSSFVLDFLFKK